MDSLLSCKVEASRSQTANRVGNLLVLDDLPETDRRAAELLAYELAQDAIEIVRCELSKAVRHAKYLPRDLAIKIAHDVDSVACPFLEVTDVFAESDWQQLLMTSLIHSLDTQVAYRRFYRTNHSIPESCPFE